jgi:hypothetical protein
MLPGQQTLGSAMQLARRPGSGALWGLAVIYQEVVPIGDARLMGGA